MIKNYIYLDLLLFLSMFLYNCSTARIDKEDNLETCQDNEDNDKDGLIDCNDSDCIQFSICFECIDSDGDNYGVNCTSGFDCDDTSDKCIMNCIDIDSDNIWDCKDDCIDKDNDQYGDGEGCIGTDCDDSKASCTTECIDSDYDNIFDCNDDCIDVDNDQYGVGNECLGSDCEEENALCNVDCISDENENGERDCDENCVDYDGDGYGIGQDCIGFDCDDSSIRCNEDCEMDSNHNDYRDCDEICIDNDRDGYGIGDDCSSDCNDGDMNNWTLCDYCKDNDGDNYFLNCDVYNTINGPDIDDNNPYCDTDYTDNDNDQYCANYDCDDNNPFCNSDCSDQDGDNIIDCNFCLNSIHEVGSYFTLSYSTGIAVKDNYVYLANAGKGLTIIDVTDIENPSEISSVGDDAYLIELKDNYAFVVGYYGDLQIIDVSDVQNPAQVGLYQTDNVNNDIFLTDNYLYLAQGLDHWEDNWQDYGGIRIIDLTDITHPFEVSFYEIVGSAKSIYTKQISGINYAIVSMEILEEGEPYDIITGSLLTLDITDFSNITELNTKIIYSNYGFIISGVNLFELGWGISIYDIRNPVNLVNISSYNSDANIYAGVKLSNYLYIAGEDRLQILDINSILSPVLVGTYIDNMGAFTGISVSGSNIFLSDSRVGLKILSILCN